MKQSLLLGNDSAYTRVDAPCPYFGTCGGCTLQEFSYPDQLAIKERWLWENLKELDPLLKVEVVASDSPWRYRNKAEFTFGEQDGHLVLGYHAGRSYWRIVDLDDCLLLPELMMKCVIELRRLARESTQSAYNTKTHLGFFRYLTIRYSHATKEILLCLITAPGPSDVIERMADELIKSQRTLTSIYWGIASSVADVALPEKLILLRGKAYLDEKVGPICVNVHPMVFLQPNMQQAQRIYECLYQIVRESPDKVAWDLYCGMGLITCFLASKFRMAYGIDSSKPNLKMAILNASQNNIKNVRFDLGKSEDLLLDRAFWLGEGRADVAVIDPPRAGLHPRALASILAAGPRQLVYVSCNAQTLMRDLQAFLTRYPRYRISEFRAFDMFPHTNHLELLVGLERI